MRKSKMTLAALLMLLCLMATAATYLTTPQAVANKPADARHRLSLEDWQRLARLP